MSDENSWKRKRAGGHSRVLGCGIALLLLGVGLVMTTALMVQARNRRVQLQSDPHVATVWLLGATWGPNHSVTFGSPSQKWLNEHNITAFGSYAVLHSPYTGEPGGVEFWFDYQSYLPSQELECHRVGEMAFTDDLGQTYHGYLDFQGKTVGVYLPAYDHAAHRLFCNIHWMPRRPAAPSPVSTPMTFMVNLPPTSRLLPPVDRLPHGPQTFTNRGITVAISEAQLSASIATPSPYSGQRYLTLRMKVSGGEIANPNVDVGNNLISSFGNGTIFTRRNGQTTITSVNPTSGTAVNGLGPLSLTDPYGIELIPSGQYLVPSEEKSAHLETSDGKEIIWSVGVNGAGRGTDVIRLQFAVRPTASAAAAADTPQNLVPFDLLVPVQTGNEI